jgi:hypothetical protein
MPTFQITVTGNKVNVTSAEQEALKVARQADVGNTVNISDLTPLALTPDVKAVLQAMILKIRRLDAEILQLRSK